jgi:hypothetical protein
VWYHCYFDLIYDIRLLSRFYILHSLARGWLNCTVETCSKINCKKGLFTYTFSLMEIKKLFWSSLRKRTECRVQDIHKIGRQICTSLRYSRVGHKWTLYVDANVPGEDSALILLVQGNGVRISLGFKKGGAISLHKTEINSSTVQDNRMWESTFIATRQFGLSKSSSRSLLHWRWKRYIPSTPCYPPTNPHSVTSHNTHSCKNL